MKQNKLLHSKKCPFPKADWKAYLDILYINSVNSIREHLKHHTLYMDDFIPQSSHEPVIYKNSNIDLYHDQFYSSESNHYLSIIFLKTNHLSDLNHTLVHFLKQASTQELHLTSESICESELENLFVTWNLKLTSETVADQIRKRIKHKEFRILVSSNETYGKTRDPIQKRK